MAGQIEKYKAAIGKRNVGSDPSPAAMANAQRTAIGRTRGSSVTNVEQRLSKGSSAARGSWEGFMHAPSAPIQMSGTGYLAKAAQKARNIKPNHDLSGFTSRGASFGSSHSLARFDYTYSGSEGNSICLLRNHMKLNNLFKG